MAYKKVMIYSVQMIVCVLLNHVKFATQYIPVWYEYNAPSPFSNSIPQV